MFVSVIKLKMVYFRPKEARMKAANMQGKTFSILKQKISSVEMIHGFKLIKPKLADSI